MTAEEIFAGESDNVEFKSDIPPKSETYMKTVVAFANGKGGRLVFGVENGTWAVTGFSKEEVFQKMDAITNAIFDSCEPQRSTAKQSSWWKSSPGCSGPTTLKARALWLVPISAWLVRPAMQIGTAYRS